MQHPWQWPEVSDFVKRFLKVFEKNVTQMIYLGLLPTATSSDRRKSKTALLQVRNSDDSSYGDHIHADSLQNKKGAQEGGR